jgi:hypothetical protein
MLFALTRREGDNNDVEHFLGDMREAAFEE